jgi:ferrous iron transport protein B
LVTLSTLLGVPVIAVDARKRTSASNLIQTAIKTAIGGSKSEMKLNYGTEVSEELDKIKNIIRCNDKLTDKELNWISLKLLEGEYRAEQFLAQKKYVFETKAQVQKSASHLKRIYDQDVNTILANVRYGFIRGLEKEAVKKEKSENKKIIEKIDTLLTNRFLGIPIFLVVILIIFQLTFKLSEPFVGLIEYLFSVISNFVLFFLTQWGFSNLFISFIIDGVIGGVGGVLAFVPLIGIMFLMITILEDSGYMARVAYVMDGLMHKIGLHGKAFIPLILGFGCNVPGIMATRTLEKKEDRLQTILINPLMSCGAKLPVYALFAGVFFSAYQGWVIFSLYFLGVVIAVVMGFIFKKIFFKGLSSPFVIELPSYRWPTLKGV